jgi:hypothetical protein
MRITAEAWLAAVFRFLSDAALEEEKREVALSFLDELEDASGIEFSPDKKKELSDAIQKLLSEKTSARDVRRFIKSFRSERTVVFLQSPESVVFLQSPEVTKTTKGGNHEETGGEKK